MFMEEILKDVDIWPNWRQILESKHGSAAFPSNWVFLKADQFSMLWQLSCYNHTAGLGFPLLTRSLFLQLKIPAPSFPSERQLCLPVPVCKSQPGQSQPGGSSPASHDHLDSSAFSSHHPSSLSLHLPALEAASSIYHFRVGGKNNNDQCQRAHTPFFLLPLEW